MNKRGYFNDWHWDEGKGEGYPTHGPLRNMLKQLDILHSEIEELEQVRWVTFLTYRPSLAERVKRRKKDYERWEDEEYERLIKGN